MKIFPLTRVSNLASEICSNVLLTREVFCTERVFLYRHGPTELGVILVGSILQGFMISLECESPAS